MAASENWVPEVRGKRAMHELARATFAALQEADLQDALDALRDRVLARGPEIVEIVVDARVCRWSFKPMVELLLRHTLEIAARDEMPADERRTAIAAALDLAGF
jgi:hypothetical protein